MGQDDPSAAITIGRLNSREWLTLRRMGVTTTAALSAVDPDDPVFFDEYVAEVSHLTPESPQPSDRSDRTGRNDLPRCRSQANRRRPRRRSGRRRRDRCRHRVRPGQPGVHVGCPRPAAAPTTPARSTSPTSSTGSRSTPRVSGRWRHGSPPGCAGSARKPTRPAQTLRVFHWSHPEWSKLKSILGLAEVGDLIDPETGVFVDVEKVFKANFMSLHGSSIKKVGPLFGFTWRVDDPGERSPRPTCPKCTPARTRTRWPRPRRGC